MRLIRYAIPVTLAMAALGAAPASFAQVSVGIGVSVRVAPPALQVYELPAIPGPGYLWTPGYWAYASDYYWVPGVWIEPPSVGVLWTPPYWGFADGAYAFHAGYWGPHVGFYGGINYGFGYSGSGFAGGRWEGGHFAYNRAVYTNINVNIIHNTYNERVVESRNGSRASFNGPGGVNARPTREEEAAEHERHVPATAQQEQHEHETANGRAPSEAHPGTEANRPGEMNRADEKNGARPGTQANRPGEMNRAEDKNAARPGTEANRPGEMNRAEEKNGARPGTEADRPGEMNRAEEKNGARPGTEANKRPAGMGAEHQTAERPEGARPPAEAKPMARPPAANDHPQGSDEEKKP